LSDNVVTLDDYRKLSETFEESNEDELIVSWSVNSFGERTMHISSTAGTEESLWMIELAKSIMISRPAEVMNNDE
jgi:hypothetical protein